MRMLESTNSAFMEFVSRPGWLLADAHREALPHASQGALLGLLIGWLWTAPLFEPFEIGTHQGGERHPPLNSDVLRPADQVFRERKSDVLSLHGGL
jgi:hypothetical protein